MKQVMGVRKVWKTRISETFIGVAKGIVSTVGRGTTNFSTMKRVATLGGKKKDGRAYGEDKR